MNYKSRQRRIQKLLAEHGLAALLITHLPNIRYLCGFTGSSAVLILTKDRSIFFSDGRYTAQASEEVQGARIKIMGQSPLLTAAEWLSTGLPKRRSLSIGIEGEHLTVAARLSVRRILALGFKLKEAPPLIEQARMVKEDEELRRLRAAAKLGSRLFDGLVKTIRPGVRESDVAAELEYAARKAGAEQMSFATIIASGKRSALPHGVASRAKIPPRGFVVCDFGVTLSGYCSDMTRTVYVGTPNQGARHAYDAVGQAQQAAIEVVRAGLPAAEVDRAARKLLENNGLANYFTHSTGHGVGLEIHEMPRIAAGQSEVLRAGMVITIEPGIYIPGKSGIRIEDTVVVTETGCDVLTPTTKELLSL